MILADFEERQKLVTILKTRVDTEKQKKKTEKNRKQENRKTKTEKTEKITFLN